MRTDDSDSQFKDQWFLKKILLGYFVRPKPKLFRQINFGRKMSDVRPLFQALLCNQYQIVTRGLPLACCTFLLEYLSHNIAIYYPPFFYCELLIL